MTDVDHDGPRPLLERWPQLQEKVHFARLGDFPTPVSSLADVARELGHPQTELFEKRDDLTSPIYGGNKIRTLEVLFGHALELGASEIWSTGAYGSNHAAAAVMHAARVGLTPGICVYPQPHSPAALENLELVLSRSPRPLLTDLPHWSALPFGMWNTARASQRRGAHAYIMEPGGAIPLGALGYVSAALELAQQIEAKALPVPADIVVAAGSSCTTAGLLLGLSLAAELGIGFSTPPRLTSVRVTPWPVTSPFRIFRLATKTSELLASITGDASVRRNRRALAPNFRLLTSFIGGGYGFATAAGHEAVGLWHRFAGHELETTYSGKAAAAVIDMVRNGSSGPIVYWSTKTSAKVPLIEEKDLEWAPARMQRWMKRGRAVRDDWEQP
jgi:D-cysteine desulfhydrase